MSKFNSKKILEKIQKLNVLNKRQEAIDLILPAIKKTIIEDNPELFLKYAFLLYHVKLNDYYGEKKSKNYVSSVKNFEKAIKILEKIIALDKNKVDKKVLLNARIYLAQIYAITGKKEKALPLAINNYKEEPSATTVNRLADAYMRLGDIKNAKIWYKKYENLLIKNKKMDFIALAGLATVYKELGDQKKGKKYFDKAIPLIPNNELEDSIRESLLKNFI